MDDPQNRKPQYSDDEIDLRAVFSAIGGFFIRIGNGIISIILAIRKVTLANFKMILILGILGVISGAASTFIFKPYYRSSMVLNSTYLNGRLIESATEKLDILCNGDGYSDLGDILSIDSLTASNIKGFYYEPFISEEEIIRLEVLKIEMLNQIKEEESVNEFIERIRIENRHVYNISIEVFDPELTSQIQIPVINYFKSNPFVAKRLKIDSLNNILKRKKIQAEIIKLDSLRILVNSNIANLTREKQGTVNVTLGDETLINPLSIINQGLNLYDQELSINRALLLQTRFEVIDGFTSFTEPEGPGLIEKMFWGGLYSLILSYSIILLIAINKVLNRIEADREKKSREAESEIEEPESVLESV